MDIPSIIKEVRSKYPLQQIDSEWEGLLQIIEKIKPKVIVEIGARKGGSAAAFSNFADTVISIEFVDYKFDKTYHLSNCNYRFLLGNSHYPDCKKQLLSILNGRKIDVLFIDGDHTYNGAKVDYEHYKDLISSGGIIAFHDIKETKFNKKSNCHVYKLWKEIKNKYKSEEITNNGIDWGGIGVIYL